MDATDGLEARVTVPAPSRERRVPRPRFPSPIHKPVEAPKDASTERKEEKGVGL